MRKWPFILEFGVGENQHFFRHAIEIRLLIFICSKLNDQLTGVIGSPIHCPIAVVANETTDSCPPRRPMRNKSLIWILAVTLTAALAFIPIVLADAPPGPFFQGFEVDNGGWNVFGGALDATRVASGTHGIMSKTGGFHAEAATSATRWGGYSSVFPAGGYTTQVDVYLNVAGGAANDTRFDFSSAINNSAGSFRRDFVFNAGFYNDSDATGTGNLFVISASNNAGRGSSFPKNPGTGPITVTKTWLDNFPHRFYARGRLLDLEFS